VESAHQVAIVVRGDLAPELEALVRHRHVWAVRTPETEEVARRVWSEPETQHTDPLTAGLTLFNAGATAEMSLLSILDTVELHHGQYSHDPPLGVIEVLGTDATDAIREALAALDFTQINPSHVGFIALREVD
jgi:hypothetical protein